MKKKIKADYFLLRLHGVEGSTAGFSAEQKDGVSISESGRLCSFLSDKVKRFDTMQAAIVYFNRCSYKKKYPFEVISCSSWISE